MAWHEKANCLDEMGRFEEALSCYDTAIQLDAYNAEAWFNKGLTFKKMGREKRHLTAWTGELAWPREIKEAALLFQTTLFFLTNYLSLWDSRFRQEMRTNSISW